MENFKVQYAPNSMGLSRNQFDDIVTILLRTKPEDHKSVEDYVTWVNNWKKLYKEMSYVIRYMKNLRKWEELSRLHPEAVKKHDAFKLISWIQHQLAFSYKHQARAMLEARALHKAYYKENFRR